MRKSNRKPVIEIIIRCEASRLLEFIGCQQHRSAALFPFDFDTPGDHFPLFSIDVRRRIRVKLDIDFFPKTC